jgi:hypothetical protein
MLGYRFARVRRRLYESIFRYFGNHFNAAEKALVLFSQELKECTCKIKADLYIGHNLGALPAVVTAARKHEAKAVFDFEDYHRGESPPYTLESRLVQCVEESYVSRLVYATAASPLIAKAYQSLFRKLTVHTINNYFPRSYAPGQIPILPECPLRLFWFSQYVGKNRGLEQVIAAMGKSGNPEIELTLLGNCSPEMSEYFTREAINNGVNPRRLNFMPTVSEPDIVEVASKFHIGLAVEVPYIANRKYCLTNKVFMYLLAGNAIIFSNTQAQEQFLQHHPGIGSLFNNGDVEQLASILTAYCNHTELLNNQRQAAYQVGQTFNWDTEREHLLALVKAKL